MDTNKDIQRLIDLFMAGQTSLEEEQQLADYFRTHTVPAEWQAYKEMFGYFDEGMPTERYDGEKKGMTIKKRFVAVILAAAAAVALLFMMTWKGQDANGIQAEEPLQMATIAPDTTVNNAADTVSTDTKTVAPTKHKRRSSGKYRYRIAPPKTYYAAAQNAAAASVEDSIRRTELLLAADIKNAELIEELLLRRMELMEMAHNMEIALAADDTADEGERAEDVY